ncbi:MAG: hypothetical protein KC431_28355 [Myxococcales bacterium]|nr:hypothetical protein [Myxococcales bacterium]
MFRHALTHDATYGLLPYGQRRHLHQEVAEQLEDRYHEDLSPVYQLLAQHWRGAELPVKEVPYLAKAGVQALNVYSRHEAVEMLSRALELDEGLRGPREVDDSRTYWYQKLGEAHYSLADRANASRCYRAAIELAGFPDPKGGLPILGEIARHVARRVQTRLRRGPRAPLESSEGRERCRIALRAMVDLVAVQAWEGDKVGFIHTMYEARRIADLAGSSPEAAYAIANLGYLHGMFGLHGVAEHDLAVGVQMAETEGNLLGIISCNVIFIMFLSMVGRVEEALGPGFRVEALSEKLGEGLWRHRTKTQLAEPLLRTARYGEASDLLRRAAEIAIKAEPPAAGLATCLDADARLRLGDVDDASAALDSPLGLAIIRANPTGLPLFVGLGIAGQVYLRQGRYLDALRAIEEAERSSDEGSVFFIGIHGHAAVLEVLLALWARRSRPADAAELHPVDDISDLEQRTRAAIGRFKAFHKMFPGAGPALQLAVGRYEHLRGHSRAAHTAWRSAAAQGETMGMPYERGMALCYLGEYGRQDERAAARQKASQIFEQFGIDSHPV